MDTDKTLRNIIISGIFLIPFIPFIVSKSMLFPFITGKAFAFRILVEILLVLWIFLAFRNEKYRPKFSWILGSFLIFVAVIGISNLLGKDPSKSFWSNYERMEGFITLLHLLVYFVITSSVLIGEKIWDWFWVTFLGSSMIMSIYSFAQLSGGLDINQGGVRVDGTFGNATYLAVFLMFLFFISLFLFVRKKLNIQSFIVVGVIQLIVLYHTATRGAILGLIGGIILTAIILAIGEKENKKIRKASIATLVSILVLLAVFFGVRNTSFVNNSPVLQRFASLSSEEIKTQGRYFVWPMAIEGFKENPLFGWGQENFNYVFNKNYDSRMYAQEQWFDRAHSIPLDWLIAGGLLGFIGYFSLFFFLLLAIWKKSPNLSFLEKSVLTGLLAAYLFQNLFVFDNLISYILFVTLLAQFHQKTAEQNQKIESLFNNQVAKNTVTALVILVVAFSLYFANYKPIRASQNLITALITLQQKGPGEDALEYFEKSFSYNTFGSSEAREQLGSSAAFYLNANVPVETRQKYFELASLQFEKQLEETPDNARYHIFYGLLLGRAGMYDRSIEEYEKALVLSPNKQTIMFELGGIYLEKGETEKAFEVFKEAYELEPDFVTARIVYGIGALYSDRNDLASEIFATVPPEVLINDDRVVAAFVAKNNYQALIQIFKERMKTNPEDIQTNVSLAVAYLKDGQRLKAVEVLENFVDRNPEQKDQLQYYIDEIKAGRDPS